jgi:HD superfamily phosphohydrolase
MEIRCPLYGLIAISDDEMKIVDSVPFQRLRRIKQLSMSHLVYPGACHSRFEHSLGTMHLATIIFDKCQEKSNYSGSEHKRRHLRAAALLHDVGHGPYSHGAERLFRADYSHERMTIEIIHSMEHTLAELDLDARLVAMLACGEVGESDFSSRALSQMISGPLGADRLDYLARDSYHAGVRYGHYDLPKIVESLCVVEDTLAIGSGGCDATEQVAFARFKMFTQVYLHRVRRAYEADLAVVLESMLGGSFPTDVDSFLKLSDTLIDFRIEQEDLEEPSARDAAHRIKYRRHYRNILNRDDLSSQDCEKFCARWSAIYPGKIFFDEYRRKPASYPLVMGAKRLHEFRPQVQIPPVSCRHIFVRPELEFEVSKALQEYIDLSKLGF